MSADSTVAQQTSGGGQLGAQGPRHSEPSRTLRRRYPTGQRKLIGDSPADRSRVRQYRLLLGLDLGASEADHQRCLRRRCCGLDPLQQRGHAENVSPSTDKNRPCHEPPDKES